MTVHLKRQLSFGDYLAYQKNDKTTNYIINIVKTLAAKNQVTMNVIINEVSLFYSLDGKKYNPWQQGDIIRRAAAHAQYSTFVSQKDGPIIYFFVDNIDEKKDIHGIVIEHIFHDWVKTFFSNYSTVGIPYKHSCISYHSFLNDNYTETPLWVIFKISNLYNQKYNGKYHPMRELGMKFRNTEELISYVNINKSFFDITEEPLFSMINQRKICAMQEIYSIDDEEKTFGIKTILDPETELSNFINHLSILNDTVLTLLLSNSNYDESNKAETRKQINLQIDELVEDKNAYLSFKLGFLFLKAMNLAFRMEKNKPELENNGNNIGICLDNLKYPQLDCSKVDISGFRYNSNDVENFCKKEGDAV